jgi:DNA mismatch endonuclease (patch repair protein)
MDTLTPFERSKRMSLVRSRDTKPEMAVRRALHRLGYRFRLHRKDLPGKPDLVFPRRKKVIFVHGCFWHGHDAAGCKLARMPKSRQEFWEAKIRANSERDARSIEALKKLGWGVYVVWECELKGEQNIVNALRGFLDDEGG